MTEGTEMSERSETTATVLRVGGICHSPNRVRRRRGCSGSCSRTSVAPRTPGRSCPRMSEASRVNPPASSLDSVGGTARGSLWSSWRDPWAGSGGATRPTFGRSVENDEAHPRMSVLQTVVQCDHPFLPEELTHRHPGARAVRLLHRLSLLERSERTLLVFLVLGEREDRDSRTSGRTGADHAAATLRR